MRLREFTLMEGDLTPELVLTCLNSDGTAIDLTNAASVVFLMSTRPEAIDEDSENVITAAGEFVDRENGVVSYSWVAGDTDQRGKYVGAFRIVDGSGNQFTVPNDDYIYIRILASLAEAP